MGISDRKEREREEMRNLIMNAAFDMFLKEGYEGTSLRLIGKKIEYSPGTIYLYYKDKDALFFDIQTRCFQNIVEQYKKLEKITDPLKRLEQIGLVYFDYNIRNPQCFNLMFLLDAPLGELKKQNRWEGYGNASGFFRVTVAECIEKRLITYTELLPAALEMWGLVHGLTTMYIKKSYEVMGLTEPQAKKYMRSCWTNFLERVTA